MEKTYIKTNENQLRKIISESIRKVILEYDNGYFCTDKDMIRDSIIGQFVYVIGKVEKWIKEACENQIEPKSIEHRAIVCLKKIWAYYEQAYKEGQEKRLLLEYWVDYGEPPKDTRSKEEKVESHMKYLRAIAENNISSIKDICQKSKMDLKELGQLGISMFNGILEIMEKYGF